MTEKKCDFDCPGNEKDFPPINQILIFEHMVSES